jgi:hypothetical protein
MMKKVISRTMNPVKGKTAGQAIIETIIPTINNPNAEKNKNLYINPTNTSESPLSL